MRRIASFCVLSNCVLAVLIAMGGCASRAVPAHLELSQRLMVEAAPEDVSYQHRPTVVVFEADDEEAARVHADCSGLVNAVLKRGYSLSDAELTEILGAKRPIVKHYAKAIENEHGFKRITDISDVRAGDILASPYTTKSGDSGHVMIADESPRELAADFSPAGMTRYVVRIVDSTSSKHGAPDSRVDNEGKLIHSGLGTGVIAIYCEGSTIAGYSWGTSKSSRIWKMAERPLFVGRFVKTEKETP